MLTPAIGVITTPHKQPDPHYCDECGSQLSDLGYWVGSIGERRVQWRCIDANGCAKSIHTPQVIPSGFLVSGGEQWGKGFEGDGVCGAHADKSLFICPNRVLNRIQKA